VVNWVDLFSLRDLDAAEDAVDAWQHSLSERAVQAGTLAVRLSHLAATARSDDGLVEVTVNTSGVPTEVRLVEQVRDHPAAWIAERILAVMRMAHAKLAEQASATIDATVGLDTATGQAVLAPYTARLAATDPAGDGDARR
jgi:DNA-binding protein YbaB